VSHAWWRWPSWATEGISGLALAAMVTPYPNVGPLHGDLFRFAAGTVISFGYERFVDANGWSWTDVGQRAVGLAVGLAITHVVRQLLHH
jgi:hypothetical protein